MINYGKIRKIPPNAEVIVINGAEGVLDPDKCLNNIVIKGNINLDKVNFNSDEFFGIRNLTEKGKPIQYICTKEEDLKLLVESALNKIEFQNYIGKIQLSVSVASSITEWMKSSDKNVFDNNLDGIIEIVQLTKESISKILVIDKSTEDYFKFMINEDASVARYSIEGDKGLLTNHIFLEIQNKIFNSNIKSQLRKEYRRLYQDILINFDDLDKKLVSDLISENKRAFLEKQDTPIEATKYIIDTINSTEYSWMQSKIWENIILDLILMNENDIRLENYTSIGLKDKGVLEPVKDKFSEGIQSIKDKFIKREKTEVEENIKEEFEEFKDKVIQPATTKIKDLFDIDSIQINKTQKSTDKVTYRRIKECRMLFLSNLTFDDDHKLMNMLYSMQNYDKKCFNPELVMPILTTLELNKDQIQSIIDETSVAVNYDPEYCNYVKSYGNTIINRIDFINKFIKDEINRRIKIEENRKLKEKMERKLIEQELNKKLREQEGRRQESEHICEENCIENGDNTDIQVETKDNFEDTIILNPSDVEADLNKSE